VCACAGVCYLAGVPVVDWLLSLVQLLYFVVTSLLWAFWQLLQPSQENRHAGLPELHQVSVFAVFLVLPFQTCSGLVSSRRKCGRMQCGRQEHYSILLPCALATPVPSDVPPVPVYGVNSSSPQQHCWWPQISLLRAIGVDQPASPLCHVGTLYPLTPADNCD
jgi:hypothetical protein